MDTKFRLFELTTDELCELEKELIAEKNSRGKGAKAKAIADFKAAFEKLMKLGVDICYDCEYDIPIDEYEFFSFEY